MSQPKVSVIIPTYRHRDFIGRTVESVFAQTMPDFEIIVVNDGSPDDTAAVLGPLIEGKRVCYVEQKNQGQSRARNRGLQLGRGEYIAFLDDDDVWPKDKLEWQCGFLDQNPGVALIGGVLETMDEYGRAGERGPFYPTITFESLFLANPFISPGQVLIRGEVLHQVGGMNPEIWGADDWDLWFRIAKAGKMAMENRLALHYRLHPNNASRQTARLLRACCETIDGHLESLPRELRKSLRYPAYRNIYAGLGTWLAGGARDLARRGRLVEAARSLRGLMPLRNGLVFDRELRARFLGEMVNFR